MLYIKDEVIYMQTENFGQRIKYLRIKNGMTQKVLANNLHVSGKTVSSWELSRTEPDIASIIKLSILFRISLDYLLIGEINHTL